MQRIRRYHALHPTLQSKYTSFDCLVPSSETRLIWTDVTFLGYITFTTPIIASAFLWINLRERNLPSMQRKDDRKDEDADLTHPIFSFLLFTRSFFIERHFIILTGSILGLLRHFLKVTKLL